MTPPGAEVQTPADSQTHMTQQSRTHSPDPETVQLRQVSDESADDGLFRIRMPVTSTAEARDGVAFDREKVAGFREQITSGTVPVFLDHGRNEQTGHRYSALGKVGYLDSPDVVERDGATDLMADFVLVDPEELEGDVGQMRTALQWLRNQVRLGVPIASSIGWSEDTGERDLPGDADLLETSIVGIPSDARTTTASAEAAPLARAVSAASSDFDVETFLRTFAREQSRPLGPPDDPDRFDTCDECVDALSDDPDLSESDAERICGAWEQDKDDGRNVVDVGGEEIDLTPPDAVQNAATVALAKDDELEPDCGTGAGRQSARDIAGDDVSADRIDDIAAYLTSHEEDVTADGPPSDWSDEEWQDCGNLQYALWGGTGTGTGLEWAQSKANEVADAQDADLPYPEVNDMTDDETSEQSGEQPDDTADNESDGMDAQEFRASMLEMQREQTEILQTLATDMGDEDDDDEDEDDDEDMDESAADVDESESEPSPDAEAEADTADVDTDTDERMVTLDGTEMPVDEAREHIADLREQADEAEPEAPATQDRAADDEATTAGGSPDWYA